MAEFLQNKNKRKVLRNNYIGAIEIIYLRKGSEYMKKIIAVVAVVLLVGSMIFVFSGCGEDDNNTTTTTSTTTVTGTSEVTTTENPGMVTDESEEGENGALGDIVTDMSEGMSDMVTDMSEGASRMLR